MLSCLGESDLKISYFMQATGNIEYHAHMIKHKCPPGMAEVSKEEMEQVQNMVFGGMCIIFKFVKLLLIFFVLLLFVLP
jgi:hypothetical protein